MSKTQQKEAEPVYCRITNKSFDSLGFAFAGTPEELVAETLTDIDDIIRGASPATLRALVIDALRHSIVLCDKDGKDIDPVTGETFARLKRENLDLRMRIGRLSGHGRGGAQYVAKLEARIAELEKTVE